MKLVDTDVLMEIISDNAYEVAQRDNSRGLGMMIEGIAQAMDECPGYEPISGSNKQTTEEAAEKLARAIDVFQAAIGNELVSLNNKLRGWLSARKAEMK